ncbi:MAG: efflux transporter outer membrane subunit [Campylobacter sp.]
MRKFQIILAVLFLTGCSFRPQMPSVDTNFDATYKFESTNISDKWWLEFNDEKLNELVDLALKSNTDLKIAFLNLQKAQASLGVAKADLLPNLSISAGAFRSANGVDTNPKSSYEINLGLNYELDLWGRVRNSVQAAKATLNATELDYHTARLSIASSVAKSYFALVALKMREAVLVDTLKTYQETLAFRKVQFDLGSIDEGVYLQSKAALQGAEVSLLEVRNSLSSALSALAVLTGKSNDEILKGAVGSASKLPSKPNLKAGISADMLLHRSDVAKAYFDLNATNALVGVARADYFPTISLTGIFGFSSNDLNNLFNQDVSLWKIGGNLAQKIFNYGKTSNSVDIAKTNEQIAAVNYEATIKKALAEIRNALNAREYLEEILTLTSDLLSSQERIYALAQDKFSEGYTSHLELLDAERNLLSTKLSLVNANLNLIDSFVDIYKAFGGGFEQNTKF